MRLMRFVPIVFRVKHVCVENTVRERRFGRTEPPVIVPHTSKIADFEAFVGMRNLAILCPLGRPSDVPKPSEFLMRCMAGLETALWGLEKILSDVWDNHHRCGVATCPE